MTASESCPRAPSISATASFILCGPETTILERELGLGIFASRSALLTRPRSPFQPAGTSPVRVCTTCAFARAALAPSSARQRTSSSVWFESMTLTDANSPFVFAAASRSCSAGVTPVPPTTTPKCSPFLIFALASALSSPRRNSALRSSVVIGAETSNDAPLRSAERYCVMTPCR
eukprot:Amastigsp_a850235_7.p3 type:complete len:175 gc:universal Amastigsp_a850235_7:86-610(+)